MENEMFFDQVSCYYDEMISFDKALENRKKALEGFISPGMKDAVDLGCGTGLDSIALAMRNLRVTSFDISEGMLARASEKAGALGLNISFNKSSLTEVPDKFDNHFDFAVSLGNTLANLTDEQLKKAVQKVYNLIRANGVFLLQILNYDALLRNKERIVSITQSEETIFVRFYDFLNESINFNILTSSKNNLGVHSLWTTKLFPHLHEAISSHLLQSGFKEIVMYSDFQKNPFNIKNSKDLVILALK